MTASEFRTMQVGTLIVNKRTGAVSTVMRADFGTGSVTIERDGQTYGVMRCQAEKYDRVSED